MIFGLFVGGYRCLLGFTYYCLCLRCCYWFPSSLDNYSYFSLSSNSFTLSDLSFELINGVGYHSYCCCSMSSNYLFILIGSSSSLSSLPTTPNTTTASSLFVVVASGTSLESIFVFAHGLLSKIGVGSPC